MSFAKRMFSALKALEIKEGREVPWSELAMRAGGIPTSSMSRYKEGKGEPSLEQIGALAQVLGVSRVWLAFEEGPMIAGVASDSVKLAEDIQKFAEKAASEGRTTKLTSPKSKDEKNQPANRRTGTK